MGERNCRSIILLQNIRATISSSTPPVEQVNQYWKITSLLLSDFPEGWNILANAFRS